MLCCPSSSRAGVSAICRTTFQLMILWDFLQGKDNLEGHTASGNQVAIKLFVQDHFDCSCCSLTYYLIVVRDTSNSHAYGLTRKIQCVQSFNSLGEYLWVCKGWVFIRRFIVAEWLRYMLLITSDLTPHKTGNMSSMPQNYLHSYSMLKQLLQD